MNYFPYFYNQPGKYYLNTCKIRLLLLPNFVCRNLNVMKFIKLLILIVVLIPVTGQTQVFKPALIQKATYFDVSPPLRDMASQKTQVDVTWKNGVVQNHFKDKNNTLISLSGDEFTQANIQRTPGQSLTDTTIENFEGQGGGGYIPPDTDGDIGPDDYFQVVNASFAIYNKSGNLLLGPLASSTVWNGMPNNTNSGDAVVLYDENANRWLFSQFSLPNYPDGPFYQMIAVSQTPDPTGSWYRYQYSFTTMPDYPKFGVWPDGYYMSCNRFGGGSGYFSGTGAVAYDRTLMLAGNPDAQMVLFQLPASNEAFGMIPSDCDGEFPPTGTPNYFVYESNSTSSHLGILEFHADWVTPANSTFGNLMTLPVTTFSSNFGSGITQKGTNVKLATLSDRLMFRLQFRNFQDHWSMVTNHTINAGSNIAGIRWYELRKVSGDWAIYQDATYAPSDNISRWMGSIAMDAAGNIALGYSVAGSTLYPSIRYTGRMSTDPLNLMTINERGIINGGGAQTSNSNRWGDYSAMTVDPTSPTTFWYTTEYYSQTSSSNWQTRIGSFSFTNTFTSYATASPASTCTGDSVQLSSVAYGGSGNYTYSWTSIPAGFTSNQQNPKVDPGITTKYVAIVSDGNLTQHDTTQVSTINQPTCFVGNDTIVCSNLTSVDLHGTANSYKMLGWSSSGDGTFSSNTSLNTTYTFGPHDYLVDSVDFKMIVFPLSPCQERASSTNHVELDACTGIPESTSGDLTIFIQPNPAHESVTIKLSGLTSEQASMTLANTSGQILLAEEIRQLSGSFTKQLNLHSYPAGMYFLTVKDGKKVMLKKLTVY